MAVIFRRFRGKIRPIQISDAAKEMAVGAAAYVGAVSGANAVRKKAAQKIKGKKSFGFLTNVGVEVGVSAAVLGVAAKVGPGIVRRGIPRFGRVLTGSFGMARRQGRN